MRAKSLLGLMMTVALAACGGNGNDSTSASSAPTVTPAPSPAPSGTTSLSGVVATGAAFANAKVTIKDKNGKTAEVTTNASGQWTLADATGFVAPLLLRATGTVAGVEQAYYSVLSSAPVSGQNNTINITPLTHAAITLAAGTDLAALFAESSKLAQLDTAKITQAKTNLLQALGDYLTALGVDSSKVDLFQTKFDANSTDGLDKVLDLVSFIPSASGGKLEITLQDKGSGASTTINNSASSIKPLAKPAAEVVSLKLSGINELVQRANTALVSKESVASSAFADLWDDAYLDSGETTQDVIKYASSGEGNFVGVKFVSTQIAGCVSSYCNLRIAMQSPDGSLKVNEKPVRQSSDGKWRFYGNQQLFAAGFNAQINKQVNVKSGVITNTTYSASQNFWINSNDVSKHNFKSAKLYIKSNTANWEFIKDAVLSDGAIGAGISFSDAQIADINAKIATGSARFKVDAFTSSDFSGTPKSIESALTKKLLNQAEAQTASYPISINVAELGTASVSFSGSNIYGVKIDIVDSVSKSLLSNTSWDGSSNIAALQGKASVAQANALCKCTFANGVINFISLSGNNVTVSYTLQP